MKKRILNLILALIMALSLVPSVAFAAGSSFSTATTISTDTWYSDKLASRDEEDYFKFTLSQSGYITLSLKHDYVDNSGVIWQSYLYNTDCEEMLQLGSYFGNAKSTGTSAKIGLPAGTYYVKIRRGLSDIRNNWGDDWNNTPYYLKINYTVSSAWETELNNTFSTCDTIKSNTIVNGSITNNNGGATYNNDIDYYKFSLSNAGYISLSFKHDYVDSDSHYSRWRVYLYDSNCNEIMCWEFYGNTSATTITDRTKLQSGTYYLKVAEGSLYSDTPYSLKVNYGKPGTPAPSISCTASSGKPTLTWSAVSGAEKYEVWRATSSSGSYSKMYTTTSTSYTNTSAKAGTTYYYKVKAISGKSSYADSAYSVVKSIRAK